MKNATKHRYYDKYDEKILVLASLLVATLILFVLSFFLGCGRDGTQPGMLGSITYTTHDDTTPGPMRAFTRIFRDDTTGTAIEIGWRGRCVHDRCMNVSADAILTQNTRNCLVRALMPADALSDAFENKQVGVNEIIVSYEIPNIMNKQVLVHHYRLHADGNADVL